MLIRLLATGTLLVFWLSPANAALQPCNVLYTGTKCVECAKGRGYAPAQYIPYCHINASGKKKPK